MKAVPLSGHIGVRAPSDLGGGGGGDDVLARKKYVMPERVGVEIGMQTETFIKIFSSNETAITGKIAQLKVCILNSINSLNVI